MTEADERRRHRIEQLAGMTDTEFAAEVSWHQTLRWQRRTRLARHAESHRFDFEDLMGRSFSAAELVELSYEVMRTWERLFTELESDGVTYTFVRSLADPDTAIITVTRNGSIRTTFPTRSLTRRLQRHPAAIEVTDRATRLGL